MSGVIAGPQAILSAVFGVSDAGVLARGGIRGLMDLSPPEMKLSTLGIVDLSTLISSPRVWIAIGVIGVATFAVRFSFIHLFGRIDEVPPRVRRILRYVPPAVLAALVVPDILTVRPSVVATVVDERLIAGFVAGVVAWRTENVFATIGAGMITLWLFRFIVFA